MNLYVVRMIDGYAVPETDGKSVARENTKIGRMPKESADAARRKHGFSRANEKEFARFDPAAHRAENATTVLRRNEIEHCDIGYDLDISAFFYRRKQFRRNFFPRAIGMK